MTIELEKKALANDLNLNKLSGFTQGKTENQLNHYFALTSLNNVSHIVKYLKEYISPFYFESIENILADLKNKDDVSIRTRQSVKQDEFGEESTNVYLVFKRSRSSGEDNINGTDRTEVMINMTDSACLEELDNLLLMSGLKYRSKWSRNRVNYHKPADNKNLFEVNLALDTNAGYGRILEVEVELPDNSPMVDKAGQLIDELLNEFGLEELDKNLLKKMFTYYEKNFDSFYGTNKLIWDDEKFLQTLAS